MGQPIDSISKERESSVAVLIGLLKKARIRWALLLFISFVGLLAHLASSNQPEIPKDAQHVLKAVERLNQARFPGIVRSNDLRAWLPDKAVSRIEDALHTLSQLNDQLAERGLDSQAIRFFTLGPEYDGLANATRALRSMPPPDSLLRWKAADVDNVLTVIVGLDPGASAQTTIVSQIEVGGTAVVKRTPALAEDLRAIREFAGTIGSDDANAAAASSILEALVIIENELIKLREPFPNWPAGIGVDLAHLSQVLEDWQISELGTAVEIANAQVAAGQLRAGSVSAVGLSIPGIVIKLLLPLLALAIAIDIVLTLAKAHSWARRFMVQQDAAFHVALFPWIPILIFEKRTRATLTSRLLSWVALAIHLAPPAFLVVLIFDAIASPVVAGIAVTAIVATLGCQIQTLSLINRLSSEAPDGVAIAHDLSDPTAELIKTHLERIDVAWTSLMTVSGAVSIFFVAFLFVPSEILGDRSQLGRVADTRTALNEVYEQRFKEHRDTYEEWSETVDDAFHQLTFLQTHFPEDHPAYALSESLNQSPPLLSYPSAKSNFDDIVSEDRASLDQLDHYDINDLIEILYRPNLIDLIDPLEEIKASIRSRPLQQETVNELPEFLADNLKGAGAEPMLVPLYGTVSHTGVTAVTPSVPLPLTYRQWVEKGGFSYRLTPLPERETVDEFYVYMGQKGFTKVAGFDRYVDAYAELDKHLGTLKLNLFGIEIDRRLAATVSPWLIVPLIALLLLRLIVARRAIGWVGSHESCVAILSGSGTTLLSDSGSSRPLMAHASSALFLVFPIFVLGLICWSSSPTTIGLDWSLVAAAVGLLLTILCSKQRMALLRDDTQL